jgi:hypothetical protein
MGSLKKGGKKLAIGEARRMMARSYGWSTAIRAKQKIQLVALTGIEPVF